MRDSISCNKYINGFHNILNNINIHMALEDEIINIESLDIADEIKIGDFVLLETTDGTKLIDFKDFIIGVDNITFFDRISGDYLQTSDISAISAKTLANEAALSSISAVGTRLDDFQLQLDALGADLATFNNSIDTNELDASDITAFTNATVGFSLEAEGVYINSRTTGYKMYFNKAIRTGSSLTVGTDITYGDQIPFKYVAKGGFGMFLQGKLRTSLTYQNNQVKLYVFKNNEKYLTIDPSPFSSKYGSSFVTYSVYDFFEYVQLSAGDELTLIFSSQHIGNVNGKITGIRVG